jgi:hypothetical protein
MVSNDIVTGTENSIINIRIAHAKNMNQINTFIKIFSRLFVIYIKKQQSVIKLYKNLYNGVDFSKYDVLFLDDEKENDKTGKRLLDLERLRPEVFKKGYSGVCHPKKRQPYLVSNLKETKKIMKNAEPTAKYPDLASNLLTDGMINWPSGSEDWYACYPREPLDKEKTFIWPGLIKKADKEFPCCYVSNQVAKKAGKAAKINKKTDNDDINNANNVNGIVKDIMGVPLAANKISPVGRYTTLPYYLQILCLSSGYEYIGPKENRHLPILRYGVVKSNDSLVHCLARAHNDTYKDMNITNRKLLVRNILEEISGIVSTDWFVVARQEMYDYTYDEIKSSLIKPDMYIDPDIYINIFAKYYGTDILIFKVDESFPNGEVSIPRASVAHLAYKIDPQKDVTIILKFRKRETDTYQCELLVEITDDTLNPVKYSFEHNSPFVVGCFELFKNANTVYITSPDGGCVEYNPSFIR